MPVIEMKNKISGRDNVSSYKKIEEKIESCSCPYCKSNEWSYARELDAALGSDARFSINKDQNYIPAKRIKAKCKSCGYVAYFNDL